MNNKILRKLSYGMYVVSTYEKDTNKKVGCIVNTVTQVTSNNPIISICINKENYTNEVLKNTKKCAVSILSEETPKEIISKFGFFSSRDIDKFENIESIIVDNLTIITDKMCGYITGEVINIVDAQTHDIFLIRVDKGDILNEIDPMTYKYYHEVIKGTAPSKAPTYIEEDLENNGKKYRCTVCGHIYDEDIEKVKFDDLPEDWVCPVCGVSKDKFVLLN